MTEEIAKQDDSSLLDPYEMIVTDMATDPGDAMELAQFIDTSAIVKAFKGIKWTIKREITELGEILDTGSPAQKIAAMTRLNNIKDRALASRGIFVGTSGPPGSVDPLALPESYNSVEMTEKTVRMTRDNTAGLAKEESIQPLLKEQQNGQEKDDETQDAFYDDTRGKDANIYRAASVDIGEGD